MKIRVVKTASNAKAVQVVRYHNNKRVITRHVGSAHTKEALDDLVLSAEEWIKDYSARLSIFPDGWIGLKETVEKTVMDFAKSCYSFNYELLFYDVTTLYFETFKEDEFRKNGFSKDNKSRQPQILVALMVTKEGFPVAHEIFSGNTFEGHTIIPVVKGFIEKIRG